LAQAEKARICAIHILSLELALERVKRLSRGTIKDLSAYSYNNLQTSAVNFLDLIPNSTAHVNDLKRQQRRIMLAAFPVPKPRSGKMRPMDWRVEESKE
jgi:hypothetical protein